MKAFVDTSVLVRYLTGDPPEMLAAAKKVVDETPSLLLTDVVLAETFADALVWAVARSAGDGSTVYSFDERFPGEGVEPRS